MSEKLRERMFTDTGVGTTDFEEKCLAVIRHLKLEAEILTKKHHDAIGEAAAKMHMAEVAKAKEESNPLIVTEPPETGGVGDVDSEALGRLQE